MVIYMGQSHTQNSAGDGSNSLVGVVEIVAFVALATSYVGNTLQKEEEWRRNQPDVMKTLGEWGQDEREREMTDFERENPNILMLNSTGEEFKNM